jgi:hypothetical protein
MLVRCAAASGAGRLGERWPAGDIPNDALFGPEYRVVPGTDPALNPICLAEGCDRALLAIRKICFLQLSLIDQTRRRHIARLHWCPHGGRDQPPDFLCTGNASPFPCRDVFGIRAEDPHQKTAPAGGGALEPSCFAAPAARGDADATQPDQASTRRLRTGGLY